MFKKLLKYDFKATKRFGVPITIGILVAGIVGGIDAIVMSALMQSGTDNFFTVCGIIISYLLFFAIYSLLGVGVLAVTIIILVDFYKNLGTDEGYLTFTLPVKSRDIIWSKVINCAIWSIITGVATIISVVVILVCFSTANGDLIGDLSLIFTDVDFGISTASVVWFFIILILFSIATFFNSILLYFDAIFFGTVIAKKNKGLSAFLSVVVVNMIYGTVASIIFTIATIGTTSLAATSQDPLAVVNIIIAIFTVLLFALNVVFFELLKHMMEKKLNLA